MAADLFANNVAVRLASGCAPGDTTLVLDQQLPAALQTAGGQSRWLISDSYGAEYVIIPGGQTGPTVTGVTRGVEGTTATSHSQGTYVTHLITAGALFGGTTASVVTVSSTPVQGTGVPWVRNLKDGAYGAKGDGITDDTSAINTWLGSLKTNGGVGFVPPGNYLHGPLSGLLDSRTNAVVVQGIGAADSGGGASTFVYTGGAGSGRAWDLRSTHTVTFEDVALTYNNSGYNGNFVDLDHSASNADSTSNNFLRCYIGGASSGATSARSLVHLNNAIIACLRDCILRYAVNGIFGGDGSYSNVITIDNVSFPVGGMSTAAIRNPGDAWSIRGCTFEALASGAAGAILVDAAVIPTGLVIIGNWFGDSSASGGDWISLGAHARGLTVVGNHFVRAAYSLTGNTHSNTTVDNLSQTLPVGSVYNISGSGIPAATTITIAAGGTSGTLSQAATTTVTGNALTLTSTGDACVRLAGGASGVVQGNRLEGQYGVVASPGTFTGLIGGNDFNGSDTPLFTAGGAFIGLIFGNENLADQFRHDGRMTFGAAADADFGRQAAGYMATSSSLGVVGAGQGLRVAEGSNCKQGTATLNGTTAVVVSNTSVTASSRIFLTIQSPGGTVGSPYVSAVSAGTSFSIKSTAAGDTSTVAYQIFEPA